MWNRVGLETWRKEPFWPTFNALCRLEDLNPFVEDSDPLLYLKILPLRIQILCWRNSGPYALFSNGSLVFQNRFESFLRGFRSLKCSWLIHHFPRWGIRIFFLTSLSVSFSSLRSRILFMGIQIPWPCVQLLYIFI